jgi:UDPglucose 6-dehydrogenase
MKIAYIGSGYVGQVSAAGAAHCGHDVILIDVVKEKVEKINQGCPTIYEEGLDEMLAKLVKEQKKLKASENLAEAIQATDASFICVGTPDKGGMIDLSYIQEVAKAIGKALRSHQGFHVVIVKSTVIPGTTLNVVKPLLEEFSGKKAYEGFGLAMNPEFLREGVAVHDCVEPDSVVIGTQDEQSKAVLKKIYAWVPSEKVTHVGITAAEAIKYAKNSFLALKVTFANEWANFCDQIGVDVKEVMTALGKDQRISPLFLRNGPGYGGSCFPKDVNAIIHAGQILHSPFRILEEVVRVNSVQYLRLIDLAKSVMGDLSRKKVGILGLSFKPNTDDTRDSPALKIIAYLASLGCVIKAYCPQGIKMAKEWLDANHISIEYISTADATIENVDFLMVPTDWAEFKPIIQKAKCPVFIGHRDLMDVSGLPNVYALGFPKVKDRKE